jgi:hypothetical protein
MATTGSTGHLRLPQKITRWYIAAPVLFIVLGMFAIIEPGICGPGSHAAGWVDADFRWCNAFDWWGSRGVARDRSSFKC